MKFLRVTKVMCMVLGLVSLNLKADGFEEDSITIAAGGHHVQGTNRIKASVILKTIRGESLTYHTYSKAAFKLTCPHSLSTESYSHGKDKNQSHSRDEYYYTEASQDTDDYTVKDGYPMSGEYNWLLKQPISTTKSVCKLEYQGIALFSSLPLNISLSDLLPLGANITLPSSFQKSELKNHLIDMYRYNQGGELGCIAHCTPLIIDLNNDGIDLGPSGVGVYFDLSNSGEIQKYQWVKQNGDEAFLVRDINGNGRIDNGSELFGSGTYMVYDKGVYRTHHQQYAPNGFVALAQYDQEALGGNDDGFITENDSLWSELQLWLDSNANGQTDQNELFELNESGITRFSIIPKFNNRMDEAGNGLFLWDWVYIDESNAKHKMVDVFFKRLE